MISEIDEVMTLLTDALGMSASYDASLEMRETNKALEDRLTFYKNEISNLQQNLEAVRAESLTDPLTGSETANISTA